MNLQTLNTKRVGIAGLAIGATTIVGAIAALFKLLSDPAYLVALYRACSHLRHHQGGNSDDLILAQLIAAIVAIVGAIVVALVMTYLGMPRTVPDPPPALAAIDVSPPKAA